MDFDRYVALERERERERDLVAVKSFCSKAQIDIFSFILLFSIRRQLLSSTDRLDRKHHARHFLGISFILTNSASNTLVLGLLFTSNRAW